MRIRRGGRSRHMGWFVAGTVLITVLSSGRFLGGGGLDRSAGPDYGKAAEIAGAWFVEHLWYRVNPVQKLLADPGREETDPGGWFSKTYLKGTSDPDPAFRNYQQAETFYQEHEYLAWYGNEESGQTAEEALSLKQPPASEDSLSDSSAAASSDPSLLEGSPALAGAIRRPLTGTTYVLEQLMDYDFLMKHFYNVHTSTTADRELMDAKDLLSRDLSLEKKSAEPQILIYHTHSQETFADSGPGETIREVGGYLAELLEEKGYRVYHDTSIYDLKDGTLDRNKAYNYALDGITGILKEHPSIDVVLDIHRDGVSENLKLVTEVDGKPTAQIMLFNGLSQTPEGPIAYLENPYREDNLAFSLQMQLGAAAYYPGYTRKIYLKGLRYNQHLRPRSALVEVGAQTNTYEEALNAMEPLAELLDMVLQGNQKDSIIQ